MAGPAQRGPRGRERSSRRGSSSPTATFSGVAAERSSATRNPATGTQTPGASKRRPTATPEEQLITRSTYRLLLMRGLAPDEAANVTAFLCGIPVADVHWSLRQVNELLFLRAMA